MFFSIITPVFNGEFFIEEYLNCLKNQDYPCWEAIIVDDLSTDDTFYAFTSLTRNDPRFIVIKNFNAETKKIATPYQARNIALEKARGEFICFLDIDDLWMPNRLSRYFNILSQNNNIDIVYSDYACRIANKQILFSVKQPPFLNPKITVHFANPIPMLTACIRRSATVNHRFPAIHHEDYIYWRNIILVMPGSSIIHVPELLGIYNIHNNSLTSNKFLSFYWLYKSLVFSKKRLQPSI